MGITATIERAWEAAFAHVQSVPFQPSGPGGSLNEQGAADPPNPPDRSGRSQEALDHALERARAGDADGFEALYQAYAEDVSRLCRRILGAGPDAEDAASEAFLRARSGFESYDPRQPFRRWLLALASHLCIDRIRRRQVEGRLFDADADAESLALSGPSPSPLRMALDREERNRLLHAIDALPARERTLLTLRHFAELSYEEIAQATGLAPERIGSQLHRARVRLRGEFTRGFGSEDPGPGRR